jgi:glycosyltransferase involved in cell wall biosynthesis
MRILFVTNSLGVGGIETNLVRLTRELTRRGHAVAVAAADGELVPDVRAAGGAVLRLKMTPSRPLALASDVALLARHVRNERPDVVHVFSAASAVTTQLSRPLWHSRSHVPGRQVPPTVASVMGLHAAPGENDLAVQLRVLLTALGARRLVVMAPAIDAVVRKIRFPQSRIVRQSIVGVDLPDGEIPDDRIRLRQELGIPAHDHVVTTIGRLEPRKSHDLFVSAAAELLRRNKHPVHFLVVGDGVEAPQLRAQIAALGVEASLQLLGHRPDIYPLLRASDVCVRPGIVEGFIGITVLEAQALGVPVVSFDTEDVRLAIRHEETGLLVPAGDVHGLAAAIGRLLDDPGMAARVGAAGRGHVRRTYGIPMVVDGLETIYHQVTGRTGIV